MNTDKVLIRDLIKTISKYKVRIAIICVLTVAFCFQLTFWIEKKYTSTFEINVYSKYFQNPLISGVIPDVYNIPEMRFAIDSMVKEAISDEFIDELGMKYHIYSQSSDEREIAKERQWLRDRFAYFSTGGQSYQISFTHSDPYIAKVITEIAMERVTSHIVNKRIKTIELVKEVMIRKLNSFNASQKFTQKGSEKALASKSPDVLKEELVKINTSIAALSKQYSLNHPIMMKLKQRQKTIISWLTEFDMSTDDSAVDLPMSMTHDKVISEQLSSKFYAKYHDFNIALEIEKKSLQNYIGVIKSPQLPTAPTWPNKRLFASLGFILGLVLAFIYVFINEIIIPSKDEMLFAEAELLDTMVLGTLPKILSDKSKEKKQESSETSKAQSGLFAGI
jgi:capsular polysaccharide biosynthesis protein